MRPLRICLIASVCLAAHALALPAAAQSLQRQPDAAPLPPRLEKLEEGEAPAVSIDTAPATSTATEKRADGGKRTEAKVTSGRSTYYVKPQDPHGLTQPGDGQSIASKPALWEVLRFSLNRPQQPPLPDRAGPAAQAPAPPAISPTPAASDTPKK